MQYFGIRDLRERIGDYAHEADAGVIRRHKYDNLEMTLSGAENRWAMNVLGAQGEMPCGCIDDL